MEALTTLDRLLSSPRAAPAPASFVPVDLLVIDDLAGPTVLRDFADTFGVHARVKNPAQIRIISSVNPDAAPPDRIAIDDLLRAFADHHRIEFHRATGPTRTEILAQLSPPPPGSLVAVTSTRTWSAAAAAGSIVVSIQPADAAIALATGTIWLRRPPITTIHLDGTWADHNNGATLHDAAIAIRGAARRSTGISSDSWILLHGLSSPSDAATRAAIIALIQGDFSEVVAWLPDGSSNPASTNEDAVPAEVNLTSLEPMIDDCGAVGPIRTFPRTPINRVFIGSCTTGSISDLRLAAGQLSGRRVRIPTTIAPATMAESIRITLERLDPTNRNSPTLADVFTSAGCDIGAAGCATCVNNAANNESSISGRLSNVPQVVVATATAHIPADNASENSGGSSGGAAPQASRRILTVSPVTAARAAIDGAIGDVAIADSARTISG